MLRSSYFEPTFDGKTGYLKRIKHIAVGFVTTVALEFAQYGVRAGEDRSGAYLFMPDGPAVPHNPGQQRLIRIIKVVCVGCFCFVLFLFLQPLLTTPVQF